MTKKVKKETVNETVVTHNGFNITQTKRDIIVTNPISKSFVIFEKSHHILEDALIWARTQKNPLLAE